MQHKNKWLLEDLELLYNKKESFIYTYFNKLKFILADSIKEYKLLSKKYDEANIFEKNRMHITMDKKEKYINILKKLLLKCNSYKTKLEEEEKLEAEKQAAEKLENERLEKESLESLEEGQLYNGKLEDSLEYSLTNVVHYNFDNTDLYISEKLTIENNVFITYFSYTDDDDFKIFNKNFLKIFITNSNSKVVNKEVIKLQNSNYENFIFINSSNINLKFPFIGLFYFVHYIYNNKSLSLNDLLSNILEKKFYFNDEILNRSLKMCFVLKNNDINNQFYFNLMTKCSNEKTFSFMNNIRFVSYENWIKYTKETEISSDEKRKTYLKEKYIRYDLPKKYTLIKPLEFYKHIPVNVELIRSCFTKKNSLIFIGDVHLSFVSDLLKNLYEECNRNRVLVEVNSVKNIKEKLIRGYDIKYVGKKYNTSTIPLISSLVNDSSIMVCFKDITQKNLIDHINKLYKIHNMNYINCVLGNTYVNVSNVKNLFIIEFNKSLYNFEEKFFSF